MSEPLRCAELVSRNGEGGYCGADAVVVMRHTAVGIPARPTVPWMPVETPYCADHLPPDHATRPDFVRIDGA